MNHYQAFPVRSDALRKYFNRGTISATVILWMPAFVLFMLILKKEGVSAETAILHFSLWFVLLPTAIVYYSLRYNPRYIDKLNYRLEGNILRVDEGVYSHKQQAIPVDLISDIQIKTGSVMRRYGISMLIIQTMAAEGSGAILWGVKNPEDVRDNLLRVRNERKMTQQNESQFGW